MEESNQYQDFLMQELLRYGVILQVFSSFKYQIQEGESVQGIEIKYDKKHKETGNWCIETHEKKEDATEWVESGILRKDNTIFWIVGDYNEGVLIHKKQLQAAVSNFPEYETETSRGYLLTKDYMKEHPLLILYKFKF